MKYTFNILRNTGFFLLILLCLAPAGLMGMEQDFFGAVSLSFDSNIFAGPSELFETGDENADDMGINLDAGYSLKILEAGRNSAGLSLNAAMTSYQDDVASDLSNTGIRFSGYYRRDNMGSFSFFVNYAYDHLSVDGNAAYYSNTITPTLFWKQTDGLTGLLKIRIKLWEDYGRDVINGTDLGIELKEIWQISDMHELSGGIFVHDKGAGVDAFGYIGMQIQGEYTLNLNKDLAVRAQVAFGTEAYKEDFPTITDPREDTFITVSASAEYDFGEMMGKAFVGVVYMSNVSNIDGSGGLPDFEKDVTSISVGYKYGFTF